MCLRKFLPGTTADLSATWLGINMGARWEHKGLGYHKALSELVNWRKAHGGGGGGVVLTILPT